MIETLCVLGYFLVGVLVSRPLYGHFRKRNIAYNIKNYAPLYQYSRVGKSGGYSLEYYGFNVEKWNRSDRPGVIFLAAVWSMAWPAFATLPIGWALYRYMTGSKIRSQAEIDAEQERLSKRINELEKELGIK